MHEKMTKLEATHVDKVLELREAHSEQLEHKQQEIEHFKKQHEAVKVRKGSMPSPRSYIA